MDLPDQDHRGDQERGDGGGSAAGGMCIGRGGTDASGGGTGLDGGGHLRDHARSRVALLRHHLEHSSGQQLAFQIVAGLLTAGAFATLRGFNLLGSAPLWALLLLLVVASLAGQVATVRWGAGSTRVQMHFRIAVHMATTTAVIYAIGWGPTLAVGYLVVVAGDLDISGSDAYLPSLGWALAGIAAGQVAIALGLVSTLVPEPLVHGVGTLAALGLAFVIYLLGTKTKEVERANASMQAAAGELAAANDAMREFVAVASHELRTPTTVIKGFASTLQDRWDATAEEDRREFAATILRSADLLGRLVDDLLTVSRIEGGAVDTHAQDIEALHTINEALDQLGRRRDVCVSAPPRLMLHADPTHVRRILRNYLDNAFRYGAPPYEVEAVELDDQVVVRVRDHGDGLPEEFVARAFQKFSQAKRAMGGDRKGTGLGLSIVKGLAEAGGGRAWYEPNQPKGSCFSASFPRT